MPSDGSSTVACPSDAVAPTPPVVSFPTRRSSDLTGPVVSADPPCAGTKTYTYTYTDCGGAAHAWVYTYTNSAPTVVMPSDGSSTVACPSAAVAPTPPVVSDNCGRTITPTGPVVSADPPCAGTKTYTYTYTDCGRAALPSFPTRRSSDLTVVMPAGGSSTVACPSD